jgi:FKBP-type peptidyl-prolyl cis-trans isomerase FklB
LLKKDYKDMASFKGCGARVQASLILLGVLLFGLTACREKPKDVELHDLGDKVGYGIGLRIGRDFRARDFPLDPQIVLRGLQDGLGEKPPLMSDQEIQEALNLLQQELNNRQQMSRQDLAKKNLEDGRDYLAQNGKKTGVEILPSGMQYQVLRAGEGKVPGPVDRVTVHYRGQLIDGTEFDSSYARNQPATFAVAGVIPGWREALQKMREGDKWRVFLPPDLAYGEKGAGSMIGPQAVLVFEIELLKVEPQG